MFVETTIKYLYSFILRQWWMIQIINWVINSFSFKLTIVCIIAIGLVVAPKVFVQIKGENNVMFGNPTVLVREALYNLGNYSQTIQYYDRHWLLTQNEEYRTLTADLYTAYVNFYKNTRITVRYKSSVENWLSMASIMLGIESIEREISDPSATFTCIVIKSVTQSSNIDFEKKSKYRVGIGVGRYGISRFARSKTLA